MSEDPDSFTTVTPGRGKKTNIVTPNSKHPTRIPKFQSESTTRASLFPTEATTEEDWVEINMGTNALIKLETLLPEMRPYKQPTTKDVITFRRELISALSKCPDPLTDQGYAYIIETESEYQARTDPQLMQTVTPVRPKIPHGTITIAPGRPMRLNRPPSKNTTTMPNRPSRPLTSNSLDNLRGGMDNSP